MDNKNANDIAERLDQILENMPSHTAVEFFSNPKYVGIEFRFSRPGWGFGGFCLSHRLSDGTWQLDDECTSRERVIEFIRDAVPLLVDALYQKGRVKFEVGDDT